MKNPHYHNLSVHRCTIYSTQVVMHTLCASIHCVNVSLCLYVCVFLCACVRALVCLLNPVTCPDVQSGANNPLGHIPPEVISVKKDEKN